MVSTENNEGGKTKRPGKRQQEGYVGKGVIGCERQAAGDCRESCESENSHREISRPRVQHQGITWDMSGICPKRRLGIDLENDFKPNYVTDHDRREIITTTSRKPPKFHRRFFWRLTPISKACRNGVASTEPYFQQAGNLTSRVEFNEIAKGASRGNKGAKKYDEERVNAWQAGNSSISSPSNTTPRRFLSSRICRAKIFQDRVRCCRRTRRA